MKQTFNLPSTLYLKSTNDKKLSKRLWSYISYILRFGSFLSFVLFRCKLDGRVKVCFMITSFVLSLSIPRQNLTNFVYDTSHNDLKVCNQIQFFTLEIFNISWLLHNTLALLTLSKARYKSNKKVILLIASYTVRWYSIKPRVQNCPLIKYNG